MRYRRPYPSGALVFLTLVTHRRAACLCEDPVRLALSRAAAHVRARHPFHTVAYVVLPDHCHLLWQLPDDAADYSLRVRLIKHHMARQPGLPNPLWQKRFWEHQIRDEGDMQMHMDYIHFNPVRHGYVGKAREWPDSSFHHHVERGRYDREWGLSESIDLSGE